MTESIVLSTFQPRLQDVFMVTLDNGATYPLTLIQASGLTPHAHPNKQRDPFQIQFTGPGPHHLPQQTYRLKHDALGELDIFLVPVGQEGENFLYQAVFT
jgi:hypothetical protein